MSPFYPKSIKWRLQVWHGLILLSVLGGFGLTAYQLQRSNAWRRIDLELEQRVGRLSAELRAAGPPRHPRPGPPEFGEGPEGRPPPGRRGDGPPGEGPLPRDFRVTGPAAGPYQSTNYPAYYFAFWSRDGSLLDKSPAAPELAAPSHRQGEELSGTVMRDGYREHYLVTKPGECVLVGRSVAAELRDLNRLAWWLAAAGGGVLALGLIGGWWLAEKATRPIGQIADTASRISGGNLAERIQVTETGTELGQLAGVLNSTFDRLEAAFDQQRQFTADASHELRTPLTVILAQTQAALSRERPAAEYRDSLEACQRAAQRMRRMAESLLELARLDAGQEPIEKLTVDLAQLVREALDLLAPLAAEKGICLSSELESVNVIGDRELLARVVVNLVTNAIHYNRVQGEVKLLTARSGESGILRVVDTGIGLSPEEIEHIFERFYRADKSRSRASGRCGLGLAICKAIIDSHSGSISATSEPGKGSEFVVSLPLAG